MTVLKEVQCMLSKTSDNSEPQTSLKDLQVSAVHQDMQIYVLYQV